MDHSLGKERLVVSLCGWVGFVFGFDFFGGVVFAFLFLVRIVVSAFLDPPRVRLK